MGFFLFLFFQLGLSVSGTRAFWEDKRTHGVGPKELQGGEQITRKSEGIGIGEKKTFLTFLLHSL